MCPTGVTAAQVVGIEGDDVGQTGNQRGRGQIEVGQAVAVDLQHALGRPTTDDLFQHPLAPILGQGLRPVERQIAFGNEIVQALPDAAVLVTVSNDAWFGTSIGPPQHLQIARARALETGRYLLRATNTGITAIVAPDGVVQGRVPQFQVQVLEGEILPMGGMTLYARTGDLGVVSLLVLMLIGGIVLRRRQSVPNNSD